MLDSKKIIVTFLAVLIVLWVFWFFGFQGGSPVTLEPKLYGEAAKSIVPKGSTSSVLEPVSFSGNADFPTYLTDSFGRTLYVTTRESCTGECLLRWPPYIASSLPRGDGSLGVFENKDAKALQYTWNGKPLYYFAEDKKVGDVNGHGFGGVWFVVQ